MTPERTPARQRPATTPAPIICVFAKPPTPGTVNTRLIPAVGESGAATLARAFLLDTIATVASLGWARLVLATTAPLPPDIPRPAGTPEWSQGSGDLGRRMERALARALGEAPVVIALGVDSPGLPHRLIEVARDALDDHDAVLGPTDDGGFYTIGLRRCPRGLLEDLPWSQPDTAARTREQLVGFGLRVATAPPWFDVDRPGDLDRLEEGLTRGEIVAPHTAAALREVMGRGR